MSSASIPLAPQWGSGGSRTDEAAEAALEALVRAQLDARQVARQERDFERADAIRDTLVAAGISITDTPSGAQWSLVRPAAETVTTREEGLIMPGNSQRRGAVRKGGKKPAVGSGGQRRRGLEGKGPTPKATEREYHPAHKRVIRSPSASHRRVDRWRVRRGARRVPDTSAAEGRERDGLRPQLRRGGAAADIPVATMYLANRIDSDDRVKEALKLATERGLAILETPRGELDRLTDGGVHQGLALQVPPYDYADAADLVDPTGPASLSSWPSTASPIRATSARSSAPSPPSVAMASSFPSAARSG